MNDIYPKELLSYLDNHQYIPRKVKRSEKLLVGKKYFILELKQEVKILDSYKIGEYDYYYIKCKDKYHLFSHPICGIYELVSIDADKIIDYRMINGKHLGFIIRYWLYKNRNDKKYRKFIEKLTSLKRFDDSTRYTVKAELYNGIYFNCYFDKFRSENFRDNNKHIKRNRKRSSK